jgi:hypothetical protein
VVLISLEENDGTLRVGEVDKIAEEHKEEIG